MSMNKYISLVLVVFALYFVSVNGLNIKNEDEVNNMVTIPISGTWLGSKTSAVGIPTALTFGLLDENGQFINVVEDDEYFNNTECLLNGNGPIDKYTQNGRIVCDYGVLTVSGFYNVKLIYTYMGTPYTLLEDTLKVFAGPMDPSTSSISVSPIVVFSGEHINLSVEPRDEYDNLITEPTPVQIYFYKNNNPNNVVVTSFTEVGLHEYEVVPPPELGVYTIVFEYYGGILTKFPIISLPFNP